MRPPVLRTMLAALPNAVWHIFPHSGHASMIDDAGEMNDVVDAFLQGKEIVSETPILPGECWWCVFGLQPQQWWIAFMVFFLPGLFFCLFVCVLARNFKGTFASEDYSDELSVEAEMLETETEREL